MGRALALAAQGWGRVHPNPLVGAVVTRDGTVVGEGWHAEFGAPHAERVALEAAGAATRGATIHCTLEPCTHQGKQPPCTDAIIAAGVARAVVALRDPDPAAGGGVEQLRAAGITVDLLDGALADRARRLNARFLHRFAGSLRPWIAVKLAVTMDGFIADEAGRSQWLTGVEARAWVHRERANHDAIAVGAETAIRDDVRLTVRGAVSPRIAPTRVIFDRRGVLPADHGIFADAASVPVVVVRGVAAGSGWPARDGVTVVEADDLEGSLSALAGLGLDSVLVEGGGRLAGALFEAGLVDRVYQVQAPIWLGAGRAAWAGMASRSLDAARRWHTVDRFATGDDTVLVLER